MGTLIFIVLVGYMLYSIVHDLSQPPHRSHGIKQRSRERHRRLRDAKLDNKLERLRGGG